MIYKYDKNNQDLDRWTKGYTKTITKFNNPKNRMEDKKMVKIDKSEYSFSETLKADDIKQDKKVKITETKTVSTRFGEKRVGILDDGTQIFLNALSLQNLCEGISDETDDWESKEVILATESSERTRGKKTIVLLVKEEQRYKGKKKEEKKSEMIDDEETED